MIYDKARDLAKAMAESEEYVSYKNAKEKAFANDTTKALLKEYMTLRAYGKISFSLRCS